MQYSIFNMIKEVREKQPLIQAYLKGEPVECYSEPHASDDDSTLFGMSVGIGLLFFIVAVGLWVWALVLTVKHWKQLPTWAKVLALIGLLTGVGGPIMTIIVVYVGSQQA